jgi:hypothetical protein
MLKNHTTVAWHLHILHHTSESAASSSSTASTPLLELWWVAPRAPLDLAMWPSNELLPSTITGFVCGKMSSSADTGCRLLLSVKSHERLSFQRLVSKRCRCRCRPMRSPDRPLLNLQYASCCSAGLILVRKTCGTNADGIRAIGT